MKVVQIVLICLCMSSQILISSDHDLTEEHFEELMPNDPLEKAFGRNPNLEEPPQALMNSLEVLSLGSALLSKDTVVTPKSEVQAAHFTSTAYGKKNEKEELRATLKSQLAIYKDQIEKNLKLKEGIEGENARYAKLTEENQEALKDLERLEAQAQKELDKLDCTDSPATLRENTVRQLQGYSSLKTRKETEKESLYQNAKRSAQALKNMNQTLAELIVHQDSIARELAAVNAAIAQLDKVMLQTDEKFMVMSPLMVRNN